MALFTAYFDASGNGKDQPRVIVSGYIANYLQWKLFEETWERLHSTFGVNRPFHMAEFVSALENEKYKFQKNARADYIAIAKDADKAAAFIKELTSLQLWLVNCGVSAIVDMSIYNSVDSVLDLRTVIPPYALGARMCLAKVHNWEKMFAASEPVECIFEEGDFEQGKFTDLMIDEGEAVPIYKKKNDFAGLQAADMYAWEQTHFLRKYHSNSSIEARREFKALLHVIPKIHTHAPVEVLIDLCHARNIKARKLG